MKKLFLKLLLAISVLLPSPIPQLAFADDTSRATISEPTGTLSKSQEFKDIAISANWFMKNGPVVVAVGMVLIAAIMLFRAQYALALAIFLGGLIAAAALKIVQAVS